MLSVRSPLRLVALLILMAAFAIPLQAQHAAPHRHTLPASSSFDKALNSFAVTSGSGALASSALPLACSIDVACSEGNGWADEINAVVKISTGCTGVLLNNARADETPYVLTARHCGAPAVGTVVNWTFTFNHQGATCNAAAGPSTEQSLSGAVVRAVDAGTDFVLLELLDPIPASYNVDFAGWSIENVAPATGTVIGHPGGGLKKITLDEDPVQSYNGSAWAATFDHGTIESGSSGSPLFNEQHEVVGLLSWALYYDPAACSGPGGDDNQATVVFGKLSAMWAAGSAGERLGDYLDPDGEGTMSVPPHNGTGAGGSGDAPSTVWLNEINADASAQDEFVEIVGPPGLNLSGARLKVYTCAGGTTTLQSTQVIGAYTLAQDYQDYGLFVLGGAGLTPRDQAFSGGADILPDGYGYLLLEDAQGQVLFDYQYDTQQSGIPVHCPPSKNTRSVGDGAGLATMGFTEANPSLNAPGFSGLTATPGQQNFDGGQTLPVELVTFEAVLDGPSALLRWETASETNNVGFEIHSKTGSPILEDEQDDWQVIGYVDGHGTTTAPQSYRYRVDGLVAGTHRFRLKQVDFDGTFAYSPEVEISLDIPRAYVVSAAYPNPFNPETRFSLSVAQAQQVEAVVFDVMGRRVAVLYDGFMDAQTTRTVVFEAHDLPSGVYLIQILGERFVASQPVTLLK